MHPNKICLILYCTQDLYEPSMLSKTYLDTFLRNHQIFTKSPLKKYYLEIGMDDFFIQNLMVPSHETQYFKKIRRELR